MGIDLHSAISLKDARSLFPGRPTLSTVYRWAFSKKLETIKVGGRMFTSREAIARFVERCTNPAATPKPIVNAARQADVERELAAVGI